MSRRLLVDVLEFMSWLHGKGSADQSPGASATPARAATPLPAGLRLPPRGRYETEVTAAQQAKLARLEFHDDELLRVLGREQAEFLIHGLEMQERDQQEAAVWEEGSRFASKAVTTFCLVVVAVVLGLVAWDRAHPGGRFAPQRDVPPPVASAAANPSPGGSTVRALEDFQRAVVQSKARAVRAHPSLGTAGSHFNAAFVARYQQLRQKRSPRLDSSDWPERLAEECARDLPAAYQ